MVVVARRNRDGAGRAPLTAGGVPGEWPTLAQPPKPNPELYLRAFELLSASPQSGVALEDSSTGVAAARSAGAYLITIPSQAGKSLDGDLVATALDDPRIVEWARTVVPF